MRHYIPPFATARFHINSITLEYKGSSPLPSISVGTTFRLEQLPRLWLVDSTHYSLEGSPFIRVSFTRRESRFPRAPLFLPC